jgi:O-antigen ligase
MILICYLVSAFLNRQNYANFLLGAWGRNYGFLTLIGLFLLFLHSADYFSTKKEQFIISLKYTLFLMHIYGLIQILKIDPINWERGSGYANMLGNPNFASAAFGIISALPLFLFFQKNYKFRFLYLVIFIITPIQIYFTGSAQGYLIFAFNILIFLYFKIRVSFIRIIGIASSGIILVIVTIQLFIGSKVFASWLNSNLQVSARIEHWKLVLRIFSDYPLFGIGIDNLGRYSGEYRDLKMRSWGQYTHPDKSHNIFLDYLVTGGIVVGIAWTLFVLSTLYILWKVLKHENKDAFTWQTQLTATLWLGYLIQTLFSPDTIFLTALGMLAAGTLVGDEKIKPKFFVKQP